MTAAVILCLGNRWHGDDGFGHHVFRLLHDEAVLPATVELVDAGVAGLNALQWLDGRAKVVVVDAVRVGAPVGAVQRLAARELAAPGGELSLHELGLTSLLAADAAIRGDAPEVVVIGAQVGRIQGFAEVLSAPLRAAVPVAAAMAAREVAAA